MIKTISCTNCGRCVKIEGVTGGGSRFVSLPVLCPYCESMNKVEWPTNSSYKVGQCDGDEISK